MTETTKKYLLNKPKNHQDITQKVMQAVYDIEKKDMGKFILWRILLLSVAIFGVLYFFGLGWRILVENQKTLIFELITSDLVLMREFLLDELGFLIGEFDLFALMGIMVFLIMGGFVLIFLWKNRHKIQNKLSSLNNLKKRFSSESTLSQT